MSGSTQKICLGRVAVLLLFCLSQYEVGEATDIPNPGRVFSEGNATLILHSTGNMVTPASQYELISGEFDFRIRNGVRNSIPFIIEDGNQVSALVIGSNGHVGLGQESPSKHLHVFDTDSRPTLRLDDGSGVPNIWDIEGGGLGFSIKDVSGATTPFSILPDAPTNSLFVAANGSVGVGTGVPNNIGAAALPGKVFNLRTDAAGTAGVARFVTQGAGGAQFHLVHNNGPVNQKVMRIQNANGITSFNFVRDDLTANTVTGAIVIKNLNGNVGLKVSNPIHPLQLAGGAHCLNGTTWTNACSRELKQDIAPITSEQARETVRSLAPVSYRYKNDTSEQFVGFIAEDVPELVATGDRKGLAAMDITAVLAKVVQDQDKAMQEQDKLLTAERDKNAEQQKLIADLSERLLKLESKLAE